MKKSNYFTDNPDLLAYFHDTKFWEDVLVGEGSPAEQLATWREVLELAGRYAGEEISQRAAEVDKLGVSHKLPIEVSAPMKANLEGLAKLGLLGIALPEKYGGAGLPFSVMLASIELLARACPSTMVQAAFYSSPAAMILRYGSEEQRQKYIPRLASGEIIGAVAMTEPQAGSEVGAVKTSATQDADGVWRLSGQKIFISSGNGEICLVLARCVPGSVGLEGLGMFILEQKLNGKDNYTIERSEEKSILRGSPTCALSFSNSVGEITGEVGDCWRQIISFMNEARVAVAAQGLGVAQAALVAATDYAQVRKQSGKMIAEHPLIKEMLLEMSASVAALRALVYQAARYYDVSLLGITPEIRKEAERNLRELTPLAKYLGAEEAIRISRDALQIHGGYGVIDEYDVSRLHRDSLVFAIYEGTSQIQSLMLIKDLLKALLRRPRALLDSTPLTRYLRSETAYADYTRDLNRARALLSACFKSLVRKAFKRKLGSLWMFKLLQGRVALQERDLDELLLWAPRICEVAALVAAADALPGAQSKIGEISAVEASFNDIALRSARRAKIAAIQLTLEMA